MAKRRKSLADSAEAKAAMEEATNQAQQAAAAAKDSDEQATLEEPGGVQGVVPQVPLADLTSGPDPDSDWTPR